MTDEQTKELDKAISMLKTVHDFLNEEGELIICDVISSALDILDKLKGEAT